MMKKGAFMFIMITIFFMNIFPAGAVEIKERNWQDETVYYLMIDRFNNGDQSNDISVNMNDSAAYHGGDFQGIIDQLDYIKGMGFTTIELTPIFANEDGGYHGYWVTDFYKSDEHFGSIKLFKRLVTEAHNRDMKVIIDFDVQHVGRNHPWTVDSAKQDWFKSGQMADQEQDTLPVLNLKNTQVQQYLIDVAKWWVEKTEIDGYRLYLMSDAPNRFWNDFSKKVKSIKENSYIIGEVTTKDPTLLAAYEEAGIDGFIDYSLNEELRKIFANPNDSFTDLLSRWEKNEALYQNHYINASFMDNQNIVRFTRDLINQNEHPGPRWKQALTYLYTSPGVPIIFYGSEIALDGGTGADNHRQMNFRTDKELIDYMTQIAELRAEFPSLTKGTMEVLYEKDGMVVYKRAYQDETAVVAINNTTGSKTVTIPAEKLAPDKELRGTLNNGLVRSNDNQYTLTINRDMSEIYVLTNKTSINITYFIVMAAVFFAFIVFIILVQKRS